MSRGYILSLAAILLDWAVGLPGSASGMLLSLGFDRPNGRAQESEADYMGLLMMAQSCYSPDAAVAFWERMQKAEHDAPPEFLSTHPSSGHRVENIQKWLPEAREKRTESDCGAVLDYGMFSILLLLLIL